jgi:hypothetical protein
MDAVSRMYRVSLDQFPENFISAISQHFCFLRCTRFAGPLGEHHDDFGIAAAEGIGLMGFEREIKLFSAEEHPSNALKFRAIDQCAIEVE